MQTSRCVQLATLAACVQSTGGRNCVQTCHSGVMSTAGACLLCGRICHDADLRDNGGGTNTGYICNACRADLERDLEFGFRFPWDKEAETRAGKEKAVPVEGSGDPRGQ